MTIDASKAQLLVCAGLLGGVMLMAEVSGVSAMIAPFSATCALLALLPNAPFSQARTLVISHAICIGLGALGSFVAAPVLVVALLVGWMAIIGMVWTHKLHAPAVAHTIILVFGKQPPDRYIIASMATVLVCAAFAWMWSRRRSGEMVQSKA